MSGTHNSAAIDAEVRVGERCQDQRSQQLYEDLYSNATGTVQYLQGVGVLLSHKFP